MKQDKTRREDKQERKHSHKPPTGTTAAPASPPPSPPPVGTVSHIIRIFDQTTIYEPYVKQGADYYRSFLAPHGVDVQYIRMDPTLPCSDADNPLPAIGIRMCEKIDTINTAGSTGMAWHQTGPQQWELSSTCTFCEGWGRDMFSCPTEDPYDCPAEPNAAANYTVNHELGHSCGNLDHRPLIDANGKPIPGTEFPYSCMSSNGGRAPSILLESEKQRIIDLLPGNASRMGISAQHATPFKGCNLPPLDREKRGGHHHRHHR